MTTELTPTTPILVGFPAAAQMLGVSVSSIRQMVRAGQLAAVDVSSGAGDDARPTYRVRVADLDAFVERRTIRVAS